VSTAISLNLTGGTETGDVAPVRGIKGKMPAKARMKAKRPRDVALALAPKERDFQAVAMEYLDLALPAQAKRMGLKAGWPDIQILVRMMPFDAPRSASRFIGFEAKREIGGRVDPEQIAMHRAIANAGGAVYVVRTLDEIYHHLTVDEGLRLRCKPQG
jgi:hypothetical protein